MTVAEQDMIAEALDIADDHEPLPHPKSWDRIRCSCGWESTGPKHFDESQHRKHIVAEIAAAGYTVVKGDGTDGSPP